MEKIRNINNIYLPERGILIELPPQWASDTQINTKSNEVHAGRETQAKITALRKDRILQKRYPTPEHGEKFMEQICPQWRQFLYQKAEQMTEAIVECARKTGNKRIAVVLFGSVSKNLVRSTNHPDSSNIDLMILADSQSWDRNAILNCIRPKREEISQEIQRVQKKETVNPIEGVGIIAQNTTTAKKDEYISIRQRILACARPLYDEYNIWEDAEKEAMPYIFLSNMSPLERRRMRKTNFDEKCN